MLYALKPHIRIVIFLLVAILIIYLSILCIRFYSYYCPPNEKEIYKIKSHSDDTIRIAYIGDSWAYLHSEHDCKIANLIQKNTQKPTIVNSFGLSGFTSKEIYYCMHNDTPFKNFLTKGYDYCIISAGINDCNKKMSPTYYKESINCIIHFMLHNGIYPIIIEIPDFDIHKIYNNQKKHKRALRDLFMYITGYPKNCKQLLRESLNDLIEENGYNDRIRVIRYKTWNNNYENDLLTLYEKDGVHLNKKGYFVLDNIIANTICQIINVNSQNKSFEK